MKADQGEVMVDPTLPAGTPFSSTEVWAAPTLRHNVSQAVVDGQVEVGGDPHIESATLLKRRKPRGRQGRIFSIFSLVRFKNSACTPTTGTSATGTCYLASQCAERVSRRKRSSRELGEGN